MSQPAPNPNKLPHIGDLVARDLYDRMRQGIETYGVPLQPFNGRDALQDLYEELLDACCYLRQAMYERDFYRKRESSGGERAPDSRIGGVEAS